MTGRVLICGGSMGGSRQRVDALVAGLPAGTVVVVGDRPGLEQLVLDAVEGRDDLTAHVFHPELFVDDPAAVEIDRAQRMLREGQPDEVIAFGSGQSVRLISEAAVEHRVPVRRAGGRS